MTVGGRENENNKMAITPASSDSEEIRAAF